MEIVQIIEMLANFSGIPATVFVDGSPDRFFPGHPFAKKLSRHIPDTVLPEGEKVSCTLTDELLCYGTLRLPGGTSEVLFGPVAAIICDNRRAQQILRRYGLPTSETGQLLSYLRQTPISSLLGFSNFIIFANYVLNAEMLDIREFLPVEYWDDTDIEIKQPVASMAKPEMHRNAQDYENILFSMVRYGQYDRLLEHIKRASYAGGEGSLAGSIFRHQKNLIICSITLAARHAVAGGLDYNSAMDLADAYIQRVELAPDAESLAALHNNMLKTYTRQVADKKINNSNSAISAKVRDYVEKNICEKITTQDIAAALGRNRSYLSTQFKKETGIMLNDFINKLKVDEAKRLLTVTDLTCANIASQLAFSSESFFLSTFKRYANQTPNSFRKLVRESPFHGNGVHGLSV